VSFCKKFLYEVHKCHKIDALRTTKRPPHLRPEPAAHIFSRRQRQKPREYLQYSLFPPPSRLGGGALRIFAASAKKISSIFGRHTSGIWTMNKMNENGYSNEKSLLAAITSICHAGVSLAIGL
jgi:hypothetical protein